MLPPELIRRINTHLLPADSLSLSMALKLPSLAPIYEEILIARAFMFNRQCWDTLYPSNQTCILDFQSDQEIEQVELHLTTVVHPGHNNRICHINVKQNIQYVGDIVICDLIHMSETRIENHSITTSSNIASIGKGDRVTVEFYNPEAHQDDPVQILTGLTSVSVRTYFKMNHRSRHFSKLLKRINILNILPKGLKRLSRKH